MFLDLLNYSVGTDFLEQTTNLKSHTAHWIMWH